MRCRPGIHFCRRGSRLCGAPQAARRRVRDTIQIGYAAGTGNAVTDLIFSIAKRDVTFFSGTAPISFL